MTTLFKAVDPDGNPIALIAATKKRTLTFDAVMNEQGGETQVQIREFKNLQDAKDNIGVELHEVEGNEFDTILFDEWKFDGSDKYRADAFQDEEDNEKVENPGEDPNIDAGEGSPGKPGDNGQPPVDNDHVEPGSRKFSDAEIEANRFRSDNTEPGAPEPTGAPDPSVQPIAEGTEPEFNDRTQSGVDVSSTPPSDAPVVETGGPINDDNSVAK